VEAEKIALVQKMGKLLDKVNKLETENIALIDQVQDAEHELKTAKTNCAQLSQCNYLLCDELHKLKKKIGVDIKPKSTTVTTSNSTTMVQVTTSASSTCLPKLNGVNGAKR